MNMPCSGQTPLNSVQTTCMQCPTRSYCIAARLPVTELHRLPSLFKGNPSISKGEHVFRSGDIASNQFHVRSGTFKTYVISRDGEETVTGFYLPGDVIGNIQEDGRYVESACALETGSLCLLPDTKIAEGVDTDINLALYKHLAAQSQVSMAHHLNLHENSAQTRFIRFCRTYQKRPAARDRDTLVLPTPMSRTDLASYLGLTLESLSRVISRLNKAGVIKASRQQIEIVESATFATF